ncbi:MAG: CBS domain-containing protein [Actinomycetes bacterium]
MAERVAAVRESTPFKEIVRVLAEQQVGALPVLDENDRLVGVVSEADLLAKENDADLAWLARLHRRERVRHAKAAGDTARALMTTPAIAVSPDQSVVEAARLLDRSGVKQLPVTDSEGTLVGIVSRRDLLKVFLRTDDEIREEVMREVFMRVLWADPATVQVSVQDGIVTLSGELQTSSSIPVAVHLTKSVEGVVDVVNRLTFAIDDSTRHGSRSRL